MRTWSPAMLCLASAFAGACGGGSSGCGVQPPGPPDVSVLFPHVGGLTDAATIVVRGTAQRAGLLGVDVAGAAATSGDGFATWQAAVPLALDDNAFAAQASYASGIQTASATVVVRREVGLLTSPSTVVYDDVNELAYVGNFDADRVWSIHQPTGNVALVSGPGVGSGPSALAPNSLALDTTGGRLFVASTGTQTIFVIDLASGERSVVTSDDVGTGPSLGFAPSLAYAADSDTLYAISSATLAVTAVSPATGNRTLISGAGAGSGSALEKLNSLAFDSTGKRLIVGGQVASRMALVAVDPASGARTILSGAGVGSGPGYIGMHDLCVDSAAGLCHSAQNAYPAWVVRTDLATGVRSDVTLAGPALMLGATAMALDTAGPRLIVADSIRVGVGAVNLLDGAVAWAWLPTRGTGPVMENVRDVALLPDGNTVALLDEAQDGALTYVDLASGARSVPPSGGVAVFGSRAMVWDALGDRALIAASMRPAGASWRWRTPTALAPCSRAAPRGAGPSSSRRRPWPWTPRRRCSTYTTRRCRGWSRWSWPREHARSLATPSRAAAPA